MSSFSRRACTARTMPSHPLRIGSGIAEQMSEFTRVCKVTDLPDPGQLVVEVGDRLVALFRVDGEFWAIDDLCTHDGGPLADGELDGHAIICPRHGARFDIRTGRVLSMPATRDITAHEVKVEGEEVWIRMKDE